MTITTFLAQLKATPQAIIFQETMQMIEENYDFTPTAFNNGALHNAAGENSGSCKLFAFAQLQHLSIAETLACFGAYYFEEVLQDPDGTGHQNIRNFMKTGWDGVKFDGKALAKK